MMKRMNDAEIKYILNWLTKQGARNQFTSMGISLITDLTFEVMRLRELEHSVRDLVGQQQTKGGA